MTVLFRAMGPAIFRGRARSARLGLADQGGAVDYQLKQSDGSIQAGMRRIALGQIDGALAEIDDPDLDLHQTVHQVRKL